MFFLKREGSLDMYMFYIVMINSKLLFWKKDLNCIKAKVLSPRYYYGAPFSKKSVTIMATIFNFCTTSKYFSCDTKLFYTVGAQLKFVCMSMQSSFDLWNWKVRS